MRAFINSRWLNKVLTVDSPVSVSSPTMRGGWVVGQFVSTCRSRAAAHPGCSRAARVCAGSPRPSILRPPCAPAPSSSAGRMRTEEGIRRVYWEQATVASTLSAQSQVKIGTVVRRRMGGLSWDRRLRRSWWTALQEREVRGEYTMPRMVFNPAANI
eukprot:2119556-Pyramimonas_sp.AAC.1